MLYETLDYNGHTIEIHTDEDPLNPCQEYEGFGQIVCSHERYTLGHKHDFAVPEDFIAFKDRQKPFWYPLYLYDHSGITISTTPFSCPWDSGLVGFIYITQEAVRECFDIETIDDKGAQKVCQLLQSEVETYNDYLTGNVYGFITKARDDEDIDSCWGFIGDPETSGLIDAARSSIDGFIRDCYPLFAHGALI